MNKRDDFTERTKKALANRAGHQCSFRGCTCPTSGPSEESDEATISIGIAAHIHAAAPGGRRYLASMSPEERKHISNGIWLCANHSIEIDRDEKHYTAQLLREMKAERENIASQNLSTNISQYGTYDLFEIGPDTIVTGEIININRLVWKFKIQHFIAGDIRTITDYIDRFEKINSYDRYVVSNELNDGRLLSNPPEWEKVDNRIIVTCYVEKSFPRIRAEQLGSTFAVNDDNDLFLQNGNLARVSGINALPQKIKSNLSLIRGESPFHPTYGSRLCQFYEEYRGTAWLNRLFKLDMIRLASIPYEDPNSPGKINTPLKCINRINNIKLIEEGYDGKWMPIEFELDVEGVGAWKKQLLILVLPYTPEPPDSWKKLL